MSERSQALAKWYSEHARAFLGEFYPERVEEFDRERKQVEQLSERAGERVSVCFLGNAAVGKSTLLNALVAGDRVLVPAGGVGPLTAQATSVEYSEHPFFEATYQPKKKLWELGFALERLHLARTGGDARHIERDFAGVLDEAELDALRREADDGVTEPEGAEDQRVRRSASQKLLEWEKQARLLITGNQDSAADLPRLLDGLRKAMGMATRWTATPEEDDLQRIARLARALEDAESGTPYRATQDAQHPDAFFDDLRAHASGALAPLIQNLRVGWNAESLRSGLTLVDLPGVGIASDVHKEVTHQWINGNTRALVLVVDRAGVSESCTRLLTESGFLQRLLTAADDPQSDPVALIVAVTRIDDVARTRRAEDKKKSVAQHFADVKEEIIPRIQGQLRQHLEAIDVSSHELTRRLQAEVVERVLAGLQVFPVSATELQKLCAADEDDKPFLADEESTNVPALRRALVDRTTQWKELATAAESDAVENVLDRLRSLVQVTLSQWTESGRAEEEAERLRAALELYVRPLREELAERRGDFRRFLKTMGEETIGSLVEEALTAARVDMRKHVKPFRSYHFKTLQAAIRRGGVWDGAKTINLPDRFTDACEQPMAAIWGAKILQSLRKETRDLANDYARLVERVADWAGEQGASVQAELVRQQRDAIRSEAKALERVGKEMVDDLREKVRKELHTSVAAVIRKGCEAFVAESKDAGTGARDNMATLCDELVDKVANGVRGKAHARLLANFNDVEAQIRHHFKQMEDPIGAACDAIVARHEERQKRSDAQRKKKVVANLEQVLAACPATGSFDFGGEELG